MRIKGNSRYPLNSLKSNNSWRGSQKTGSQKGSKPSKAIRSTDKNRFAPFCDLLTQDKLASLKQGLAKFPNPQKRNDLQAQVAQLGQSVEERKRAELTREKIDSITAQAAKQGDVRKRNELLGQLNELGKTPAAGPAGKLDLLGQRHNLESQLCPSNRTNKNGPGWKKLWKTSEKNRPNCWAGNRKEESNLKR